MTLSLVLIAAACLAVATAVWRAAASLSRSLRDLGAVISETGHPDHEAFGGRLGALEAQVVGLPRQWEEFRNEARRAEQRARAIVRDARKELEGLGLESPALDAQGIELRGDDGGLRESGGVHAVSEGVDSSAPSAVGQDWAAPLRRKKYGA